MSNCNGCGAPILWVTTAKNKKSTSVDPTPVMRPGSEPPPKGKYYDADGNFYDAANVPCQVEVFLSHLSVCPASADFHKRKNRAGSENAGTTKR